jgi:hypothetical protein
MFVYIPCMSSLRPVRVASCLLTAAALVGCGGGAPAPKARAAPPPEAARAQPAPRASTAEPVLKEPPTVQESPGFREALAALRPAGTEAAAKALSSAPASAEPYALAALAYAGTNAPGMTLIWGMTYQAMGGGASDVALAKALAQVLHERIQAGRAENGRDVSFSVRLAPGQMPTRQNADGSVEAPLIHVFETLFGPAVVGFRPPWTIEQFYDAISSWAGMVSTHGTPLDEKLELDAWLVSTAKAEHLEAFCHQLLGPAFPAEYKAYKAGNAPALKAYAKYSSASALRPQAVPMPDDLVRIK